MAGVAKRVRGRERGQGILNGLGISIVSGYLGRTKKTQGPRTCVS